MKNIELHPLCTLFPRMDGEAFATLVADIKANGQREPITLVDGLILDGGNRYRACIAAGRVPQFVPFRGDNIVSFVLSANLHRRHMTPGQQAAIVASAQDWAKAHHQGGSGANQHASKPATLPVSKKDTVADRAAQSGASERTQRMADKVARKSPELAKKVAHGEISLPKAAKQIAPKSAKPSKTDGYFPWSTKTESTKAEPDADDGSTLADLVDELQAENTRLTALIKVAEADDLKAEAVKWRRVAEHAQREQGIAMDRAAQSQSRETYAVRMCRACGKAAGVADPNHTDLRDIVKAVQVMAKAVRHAA